MQLTGQWADSLLALELLFLTKLLIWGAVSVATGSGILALFAIRNVASALVRSFAIALVAFGAAVIAVALIGRAQTGLRDLPSAISLERLAWFSSGLAIGVMLAGVAITVLASILGRRLALVGAGTALSLHSAALLVLTLQLAASVVR